MKTSIYYTTTASKEKYILAIKVVKQTLFSSKKKAEKGQLKDVENDTQTVFRIAKEMKKENKDIVCERRILGNSGKLVYSLEEEKTWK